MKLNLLFLIICCCQALFAQGESKNAGDMPYASTTADRSKRVVKVVHVKGNAEGIAALAGRASGVNYEASTTLKAIVLRGEPADVANVERTIQELDNPNRESGAASGVRNIELTIYAIAGSSEPLAGFEEVTGDALAPVLKQLRAIFPYKHYELLTTVLMRSAHQADRDDGSKSRPRDVSIVIRICRCINGSKPSHPCCKAAVRCRPSGCDRP
jgi:hypothetical protein